MVDIKENYKFDVGVKGLKAKLNLLRCCMEWLAIACEACIFVCNLMSTAAFNYNLIEKGFFCEK